MTNSNTMTREEALKRLKGYIPSFNRKYIHWEKLVDKEQDMSWLFLDEFYRADWNDWNSKPVKLPTVIPYDFLIGIEGELNHKTYHSIHNWDSENYPHRHIALDITDFGNFGNTHKYGTMSASGIAWREDGTKTFTHSSELQRKDPLARAIWKMDLRKILSKEDLGEKGCDWEGFDAGEATQRFSNMDELLCTAAYVALFRFQGPLYLNIGAFFVVPEDNDYLLRVDENDNVIIAPKLRDAMRRMEEVKYENLRKTE